MKDIKKEFENSFAGYHKDAPSHLRKESAKLKALNKVRTETNKQGEKRHEREDASFNRAFKKRFGNK